MTLRPAPADTGVGFPARRLASPVDIPARADLVGETKLSLVLVREGVKIYTVEHLMSRLAASAWTTPTSTWARRGADHGRAPRRRPSGAAGRHRGQQGPPKRFLRVTRALK